MFLSYTIPASSSSDTTFTGENGVYYGNNTTYGAYYTWCAATAGKGRYCTGAMTTVDDSEYSICPIEWRLPSSAEYNMLLGKGYADRNTIATNKGLTIAGGFFPAAGYIANGSLRIVGSEGAYWSSTAYDSNNAYTLYFDSNLVDTATTSSRFFGIPVRCIAP